MSKIRLFVTALLLVAYCVSQPLIAQTPTATVKRGFKIEYTNILPNADVGEVPIRVRITRKPAVPSVNDQSFNLLLNNGWSYNSSSSTSTSTELVLPAGKTSAEAELLLERDDNYYSLLVEQGKRHTNTRADDLFHEHIDTYNNNRNGSNDTTWLLVSSKAPKSATFSGIFFPGQSYNNGMNATRGGTNTFTGSFAGNNAVKGLKKIFQEPIDDVLNRENWHALQPAELPQNWIGLSAINYLLIASDEFESLTQTPAYRKIIEKWVAAGGCLIVFNSKNSLKHADSVFPALLGSERSTPPRRWAAFNSSKSGSPIQHSMNPNYVPANKLTPKNRAAFSPYLNGMVVAVVSPEKLPRWFKDRHFRDPTSIAVPSSRISNVGRESAIPGVGKPPIALFGFFTGLFLFLIGPVILVTVTLNNNRRFLFFLVPVFSFLTCTGILGYAIIADFNKQLARTDTITALDFRSGFAYTQACSAYYCGDQPSYYAYDPDTLIQTTVENRSGYRIRQLPEENRLSSPRIQPRKSHEVFTAKPYRTQQRFLVAESDDDPDVPQVTNLLGGRIERAIFEHRGKCYLVKDLEPKQTAVGVEMSFVSCRKDLRQAVVDRQVRGGSPLFRSASSKISSITNRQEKRDFIAVIDVNPAIDPLIEPFEYKLQLHVVHGKY